MNHDPSREHDYLRQRLMARLHHVDPVGDKTESLDSLRQSEWNAVFEEHCRIRLIMGRFRYGRMDRKSDTNFDRVESAIRRLKAYKRTGNLEFLADSSNLCMLEFTHSEHPNKHFEAIDDGEHCKRT